MADEILTFKGKPLVVDKFLMFKGGCVNCGAMRDVRPPTFGSRTQLYLIREDGNKTVVGMCDKCYSLPSFDYDVLRDNLAASEAEFARESGKQELKAHAEGFKTLKFVGHAK